EGQTRHHPGRARTRRVNTPHHLRGEESATGAAVDGGGVIQGYGEPCAGSGGFETIASRSLNHQRAATETIASRSLNRLADVRGVAERGAGRVRVLAGDAAHREGVTAVRCDIALDRPVVETEQGDRVGAGLSIHTELREAQDAL